MTGYAFGQVRNGTQEYHQSLKQAPAAVIDLPYAPDVVRAALANYLTETSKATKNGLKYYHLSGNTLLVRNNVHDADIRFGIGRKSEGNKNESVVYL
ncbi:MAG: hypothetical protein M3342_23395, partial [Bacteroidota bacterium]|nr:hypothetical protein [Bacteroidota bacterium]